MAKRNKNGKAKLKDKREKQKGKKEKQESLSEQLFLGKCAVFYE